MSKIVVSSIRHSVTGIRDLVVDLSYDYDTVADTTDISNLKNIITQEEKSRITSDNAVENKCKEFVTELSKVVSTKAGKDEVKQILSASYLNNIKDSFELLLRNHITSIQEECYKQHKLFQKDADVFNSFSQKANEEVAKRLEPINKAIKEFNNRTEILINEIAKIGGVQNSIISLNQRISAAREEIDSLLNIINQQHIIIQDCENTVVLNQNSAKKIEDSFKKINADSCIIIDKVISLSQNFEQKVKNNNQNLDGIEARQIEVGNRLQGIESEISNGFQDKMIKVIEGVNLADIYNELFTKIETNVRLLVQESVNEEYDTFINHKYDELRNKLLQEIQLDLKEKEKKSFWSKIFGK